MKNDAVEGKPRSLCAVSLAVGRIYIETARGAGRACWSALVPDRRGRLSWSAEDSSWTYKRRACTYLNHKHNDYANSHTQLYIIADSYILKQSHTHMHTHKRACTDVYIPKFTIKKAPGGGAIEHRQNT